MKANKLSKRKYKKIARKNLTRKRLTRKRLTRNNYKKKIKRGGTYLFKKTSESRESPEPIQAPEPRGQKTALKLLQMGDDKRLDTVPEEVLKSIKLDQERENQRSSNTALRQAAVRKGKESATTVAREVLKKTVPGGEIMFSDPDYTEDTNKTVKENARKLNNIINLLNQLLHRGNTGGISKAAQLESKARPLLKESENTPENTPENMQAEKAPENMQAEKAP